MTSQKTPSKRSVRLFFCILAALVIGVFCRLPDYRKNDWIASRAWPQQDLGEGAGEYSLRSALYAFSYPFLVFREYLVTGLYNINLTLFWAYYAPEPALSSSAYVLSFSKERPPVDMIVPASAVRFFFDLDGDGDGEKTSWVNEKGMILFYDINGNNFLDNGEELLGVKSKEPWTVLKKMDSNKDTILNNRDPAFAKLRLLWDKNGNQKFSRSEVFKASEKIRHLILRDVSPVVTNVKTDYINPKTGQSTPIFLFAYFTSYIPVVTASGRNTILLHMTFEESTEHPFPTLESKLAGRKDAEDILKGYEALPNLAGYGNIADLRAEMYGDPVLKKMVSGLSAQTSDELILGASKTDAAIESLFLRWGQVQSVQPYSRGWFIDGRILTLLEKMNGKDIYSTTDLTPLLQRALVLKEEWRTLYRGLRARLLLQTDVGRKIFPGGVTWQKDAQDILITGSLSDEYLSALAQKAQSLSAEDRRLIFEIVGDMSALQNSRSGQAEGETDSVGDKEAPVAKNTEILSNFQKRLFPQTGD